MKMNVTFTSATLARSWWLAVNWVSRGIMSLERTRCCLSWRSLGALQIDLWAS
jgi:hypothetical protein